MKIYSNSKSSLRISYSSGFFSLFAKHNVVWLVGRSGSGKSYLSEKFCQPNVIQVHLDDHGYVDPNSKQWIVDISSLPHLSSNEKYLFEGTCHNIDELCAYLQPFVNVIVHVTCTPTLLRRTNGLKVSELMTDPSVPKSFLVSWLDIAYMSNYDIEKTFELDDKFWMEVSVSLKCLLVRYVNRPRNSTKHIKSGFHSNN